jgi:hypothetical protein
LISELINYTTLDDYGMLAMLFLLFFYGPVTFSWLATVSFIL